MVLHVLCCSPGMLWVSPGTLCCAVESACAVQGVWKRENARVRVWLKVWLKARAGPAPEICAQICDCLQISCCCNDACIMNCKPCIHVGSAERVKGEGEGEGLLKTAAGADDSTTPSDCLRSPTGLEEDRAQKKGRGVSTSAGNSCSR